MTKDGELLRVIGESGKEYFFKCKDITKYPEETHLLISDQMTVYIFVKDMGDDKPLLIDIGHKDTWSFLFKNIENFTKIRDKASHFLHMRVFKQNEEVQTRYDIIDGESFNMSEYQEH